MSEKAKDSMTQKRKNTQSAIAALKKIKATKEKQKQLKIIRAIARIKDPWANEVLLNSLEVPSEEISNLIIKELAQRENLDLDMVYQKLTKPPWYVKNGVLRILGLKKNPFSVRHIEAVLDEPNVDVRKTAAEVLGQIGGEEALELLSRLTKDNNPFVRKSAEEALTGASKLKFI